MDFDIFVWCKAVKRCDPGIRGFSLDRVLESDAGFLKDDQDHQHDQSVSSALWPNGIHGIHGIQLGFGLFGS